MPDTRLVSAIAAAGVIAAGIATATASAGGPGGVIENLDDISVAVGTGVFEYDLVGFLATGNTNEEASAKVIAQCEAAGGMFCTSDMATNEDTCIVSVADPVNYVVVGGAGITVSDALENAILEAEANNMPISVEESEVVVSDCWEE